MADRQSSIDAFYRKHGPCCAGCDWWRHFNAVVGECTASAPVAAGERFAMLGIESSSLFPGAGHVMTPRDHKCGRFVDTFDWAKPNGQTVIERIAASDMLPAIEAPKGE